MSCVISATVKTSGVSRGRVAAIVRAALAAARRPSARVGVHFVGERRMRTLNRASRGVDRPTDVLSFPLQSADDWGDIFLCVPYLQRQAGRFGVPYAEEAARMLIHGILHLSGHDHDTKRRAATMFALQERVLRDVL
jgi:probable rRNA maturation factor